ncbi:MAG TPA: hypothetical protein VH309_11220 [Elusimicrobiota bacterium]|jgi:hypothetical protein|nr:hypothetical protein [Elusimicrobiota bacterium]
MSKKEEAPFARLESGVTGAIKVAGAGAKAVVDSVADVFACAVRKAADSSPLAVEAAALAESAVRGAAKAGGDLGSVGRGFLVGVLRESGLTGADALDAISHAAGAFVRCALGVGGDAAAAARGLVEGSLVWAREFGQDAAAAGAAAGQAAADAAYGADARIGEKVREALNVGIGGVTIRIRAPKPRGK